MDARRHHWAPLEREMPPSAKMASSHSSTIDLSRGSALASLCLLAIPPRGAHRLVR